MGCHDFHRSKCKGAKKIEVENQSSLFESWVTLFRNHLSDSLVLFNGRFSHEFELKENASSFDVLISYEIHNQKKDFMKISVNLDAFEIQIDDALTSPIDTFTFDDQYKAFTIIDNEIDQRRILLDITPAEERALLSHRNNEWEVISDKPRKENSEQNQDLGTNLINREHTDVTKQSNDLDYFKIEECRTITPLNENHKFIREGILHDKGKLSELRKANDDKGRLMHHGFPLTLEEKDLILEMHKQGKTKFELERYFQRSRITITKTIEKYS